MPQDTPIPFGLCQCGCGERTTVYQGKPRKYIVGHVSRGSGRPSACRFSEDGILVYISLTQGKEAIIDAADLPIVAPYRWHASKGHGDIWYAKATIQLGHRRSTTIFMHRIIDGAPEDVQVDHRDHDGLNNRRHNVRRCGHDQNLQNMRKKTSNTSGYIGVQWEKRRRHWVALLLKDGKNTYIGSFRTAKEAAIARDRAALASRGVFAVLNFPEESP